MEEKNLTKINVLSLVLTHRCNLNCKYCLRNAQKKRSEIPYEYLKKLIRKAHALGCRTSTLTGGEAILYSHFEELCDLLGSLGWKIHLESNGILLTKERIRKILKKIGPDKISFLISVDSWNKEKHEKVRGTGSYAAAINSLINIKNINRKIELSVNSVIHKLNYPSSIELFFFINKMLELGVARCCFSFITQTGRGRSSRYFLDRAEEVSFNQRIEKAKRYYANAIKIEGGTNVGFSECRNTENFSVCISYKGFHPCLYMDDVVLKSLTQNKEEDFSFLKGLSHLRKAAYLCYGSNQSSGCCDCVNFLREYINNIPFKIDRN